ncbi:MAG: hypothetical protein EP338_13770 [Bacteroidetes bacterium]|nr:MAG: hypothetical protein EP338_13770 [Bacteroidota bacterium]
MLTNQELERYARQIALSEIGAAGQQRLKQASVLVIGVGGLGCQVLQQLTAAGVGRIGMIDGDRVELSNLQRQCLFGEGDVGRKKTEVAQERLKAQNSQVQLEIHEGSFHPKNAETLVAKYDLVVDASDRIDVRYLINDACVCLEKAFVYASLYAYEAQVALFNAPDDLGNRSATYRCLFPEESGSKVQNCQERGVLAVLPALIGAIQANEVLNYFLGLSEGLSGRLLLFNQLNYHFQLIEVNRHEKAKEWAKQGMRIRQQVIELSPEELREKLAREFPCLLVDVRDPDESPELTSFAGNEVLSKAVFEKGTAFTSESPVFICQTGVRSQKEALSWSSRNNKTCYSLRGGVLKLKEDERQKSQIHI